jgi:hypothetical protein
MTVQTTQWPKDTKGEIRSRKSKGSLSCLPCDLRLLITPLVYCGHWVVCPVIYGFWLLLWYLVVIELSVLWFTADQKTPKEKSEAVNQRTENSMTTRHQSSNQKPQIKGQTTQWPQDIKGVIRSRKSKDRQLLVYCGHWVVCPVIYGFWLLLWYLVVIELSVLWFTASDYSFGIQGRQLNDHKIPKE